jgi:hypothetical protein
MTKYPLGTTFRNHLTPEATVTVIAHTSIGLNVFEFGAGTASTIEPDQLRDEWDIVPQSATHVRSIDGWNGSAHLYKLAQPVRYRGDGVRYTDYVMVSAVLEGASLNIEIFPCNSNGTVNVWRGIYTDLVPKNNGIAGSIAEFVDRWNKVYQYGVTASA